MSFDNIKLDKGLYTTGKSFTEALEAIDPSENYKGTSLEGLDAFERQLKRFNIKVSGKDSDTISKFYLTTDSAVLFPEYISRSVYSGITGSDKVEKIVATTTNIEGYDYRSITSAEPKDLDLDVVDEGGVIPTCEITLKDNLTQLAKYGRMLTASYEAIKFQKLDLFSVTLKKIGEQISNSQFDHAVNVLNDNEPNSVKIAGNDIAYADLVNLWISLNPYNLTTLIVSPKTAAKLLTMPEFRDSNAGLSFHGTGKLITPFGAEMIISSSVEDDNVMALDRNYALEKVQASGVVTEFDKLIDRQLERATITTIVGFSPIFKNAVGVLEKA